MMVFGNTGDRSGDRRRLHAQPGDRREGVLRRVPDQRAGRGRRRRHPHAAADSRARAGDAEGLQAAARDHDAAREALQGRPGLRVHDPGRAAVHAADAQRQAHRLRRRRDRHRPRRREADHAEGGGAARRSRSRSTSCWRRASIRTSGRRFRSPTKGLPASPGAASGQVVFSADHAVEWTQQGKQVILVRRETVPDDIHGMFVAQGILTATGGMTSHAAVVGRQMGKPSIVGAGALEIDEHGKQFTRRRADGQGRRLHLVRRPDRRGEARAGGVEAERDPAGRQRHARRRRSRTSTSASSKLLTWADKFRRLGIRANADLPDQAELAYAFGARGIGLCRTEHMFFGEGRIPIVQRMILADNEADRRKALDELLPLQREDFYGVFKAMHGDAGHDPDDRSAAARVPAEARRADGRDRQARDARARTGSELDEKQHAAAARRAAPRVQPDARPPRRAPRHHVSGDHRDADAGDHRGRLPAEQGRARRSFPRS